MIQRRRWRSTCLWLGILLLLGCIPVQAQKSLEDRVRLLEEAFKTDEKTFRAFWRDGLRLQTLDKEIEIRIGGRLQLDFNFFFPGDEIEAAFGDAEDRIFFRRARTFIRGTLYKFFDFQAEFDFAGSEVTFTDVYIGLREIPYIGSFTVGRFKVPFGLEELTSSRFITFQERSLAIETFAPSRELGFILQNVVLDERLTWAFSVTRAEGEASDTTSSIIGSGEDINIGARLTGLPWYANKGQQLVHVGVAYVFRNFLENEARFRTRPEARLRDVDENDLRFVDTGTFGAESAHQVGFEAALVYGPFSLQGEYMMAFSLEPAGGLEPAVEAAIEDATFSGFYVMASYFITGESRPYDRGRAIFDRPRPKGNFLRGGYGAWEVAVRLSHIDLKDAEAIADPTDGGKQLHVTFGVNWYPNPNTRLTWNYIYGTVDRLVDGMANGTVDLDHDDFGIFSMRVQVDF